MSDEITRNATAPFGDDSDEMIVRQRLDDRTTDALFSGRVPPGHEDHMDVAAFAERLRAAASQAPAPAPNTALAAVLADGLSTPRGDQPATAGRDAPTPVMDGAGRPERRRTKRMLELLITKLAGISLIAKTSVAAAALAAGATGAGLTGSLPEAAQGAFDRAFNPPATEGSETEAPRHETPETTTEVVTEQVDAGPVEPVVPERPVEGSRPEVPGAEGRATASEKAGENGAHGRAIAEEAATDGRAFGQRQAEEAQQRRDSTATGEQRTGEDASSDGRETANEASDGRSQSGEDAASAGSDNADGTRPGGPDEKPAPGEERGRSEDRSVGRP